MATYERFQILSSARQDLFQPESPVWVSRCQLSRDLESGKRLLQVRMVNCSERTVRQIFLRVVCLGANRERLTQLELVPMPSMAVLPGRVFGDDKLVELPVKGVAFAEAYAQRVRFADGTAWDETDPDGYLAFKAVPVRADDPHAETLEDRARSGGVRNNCYFRAQQGLWVCTCGMPNATRTLRCVRCGADRLWLEKHMDQNLIDAPAQEPVPAPAPVPAPEPAQISAQMPTVLPFPIRNEPTVPPTIIVQTAPEPEPEPEEAPPSHAGRNAAIIFAVLILLSIGAYCAWRWLMPYLRYREALKERAAGNYDQAVTMFEDLKDYRDSPEMISDTLTRKAVGLMGEEKYQEALDILETVEGSEDKIADCIYALGVLALNGHDPETAMSWLEQLRQRFPDYSRIEDLAQPCFDSLGKQAVDQAAVNPTSPAEKRKKYEEARAYFVQANGYGDSATYITACDYWIAGTYREEGELETAIEAYAALGSYSDAAAQRQDCMFEYIQQHLNDCLSDDSAAHGYLTELVAANYPGAQELLDRVNGVGFSFQLLYGDSDTVPPEGVTDLTALRIAYSVERWDAGNPVRVLMAYELPDGTRGSVLLNTGSDSSGTFLWGQNLPSDCRMSGLVTLRFYDAQRGNGDDALLEELSFRYAYREPSDDETSPAAGDGQDPGNGGDSTDPGDNAGGNRQREP